MSSFSQRVRNQFAKRATAAGRIPASFYFRLAGQELTREVDSMTAGLREYEARSGTEQELYFLRRHIHMIEKGLTMIPRRDSFALDYIGRTVAAFRSISETEGRPRADTEEQEWMEAVLVHYFEATESSKNPKIERLRSDFEAVLRRSSLQPALSVRGPQAPDMTEPGANIDDITSIAVRRKSVRWYTSEKVDRSKVDRAVAVAAQAPTACNRQPYRFEIFDDPVSVAKIAEIPMGTRGFKHQLPGMIVVVGDMSAFFDPRDRHLIYIDGSLAVMGLLFGLESQGVASCCINWPDIPEKESQMAELLGLQPYERVIMLVSYGMASGEGLVPYSGKRDVDAVREFRTL